MTAAGLGKSVLAEQLQSMMAANSGPQGSAPACSPGSVDAADATSHSAAPSELRTLTPPGGLAPELADARSGLQGSAGTPAPAHPLDYLRSHMTQDPLQHVAPLTTVEGESAEPSEIANEAMPSTAPSSPALSPEPAVPSPL